MFSLRFPEKKIEHWSSRNLSDDFRLFEDEVGPAAKNRGYLTRPEFLSLCAWKTPRSKPRCAANAPALVQEATEVSLAARHEELRIGALLVLDGVGWPTASVILHFCSKDQYPILDFRAIWSLNSQQPSAYTFHFWWEYVVCCRTIAKRNGVSMRTLDRALWQYSKERQPIK